MASAVVRHGVHAGTVRTVVISAIIVVFFGWLLYWLSAAANFVSLMEMCLCFAVRYRSLNQTIVDAINSQITHATEDSTSLVDYKLTDINVGYLNIPANTTTLSVTGPRQITLKATDLLLNITGKYEYSSMMQNGEGEFYVVGSPMTFIIRADITPSCRGRRFISNVECDMQIGDMKIGTDSALVDGVLGYSIDVDDSKEKAQTEICVSMRKVLSEFNVWAMMQHDDSGWSGTAFRTIMAALPYVGFVH